MKEFIKRQWARIPVRLRDGVIVALCTAVIIFFVQFVRGYVNEYDTMKADRDKWKAKVETVERAEAQALALRISKCSEIEELALQLER